MPWLQVAVTADQHLAPQIADFLSDLGAVSVTYLDAADRPVYEPPPGTTVIWEDTRISALFDTATLPELLHVALQENFGAACRDWSEEILPDQDWTRAWLEHYQPMWFGGRLWVGPHDCRPDAPAAAALYLDPGLAFGSGTHPTTALCLEWLATHELAGRCVIDYGCGSGILAIAALLLGASEAYAVDLDPQALAATTANAEQNGVAARLHVVFPEALPRAVQGDGLVANILAQPLIELAPRLVNQIKPGGFFLLSGLLHDQADAVTAAYREHGIVFETPRQREDWCLLVGTRPRS